MLGYWGLIGIVGWLVTGWLPTYYKENFNLSQGIAGLYATGYLYPASITGLLFRGVSCRQVEPDQPACKDTRSCYWPLHSCTLLFFCKLVLQFSPLQFFSFMLFAVTRAFGDSNMMPMLCMVADSTL